jgi:hypothetical protein
VSVVAVNGGADLRRLFSRGNFGFALLYFLLSLTYLHAIVVTQMHCDRSWRLAKKGI